MSEKRKIILKQIENCLDEISLKSGFIDKQPELNPTIKKIIKEKVGLAQRLLKHLE